MLSKHMDISSFQMYRATNVNCYCFGYFSFNRFSQGGPETKDEMCMAYLYYYPAIDLATCESVPTIEQSLTAFDLEIR